VFGWPGIVCVGSTVVPPPAQKSPTVLTGQYKTLYVSADVSRLHVIGAEGRGYVSGVLHGGVTW
jgi:hypothetical protein